jgi:hypothetical protein
MALLGYWLTPSFGSALIIASGPEQTLAWPQIRLEPDQPLPRQQARVLVADTTPWVHIKLLVKGEPAEFERYEANEQAGIWTWSWSFIVPDDPRYEVVFYHDCDTCCIERTRWTIGVIRQATSATLFQRKPTKLGVVFANPERDWNNRSGWNVELTYARQAEADYWGVDDLAERAEMATGKGLRILVRVDYDQGQSLPPTDDFEALDSYLRYIRRLARDERLKNVYGYVMGSGANANSSNSQAPQSPVTPEWYARVFNGYGTDPTHTDNVVEVARSENPTVRVLVGPVRPWITDQTGQRRFRIDTPWLNYMNTLVAYIDASASAKAAIGISNIAPDGFALQAPGRPNALELASESGAQEPLMDLHSPKWNNAQMGFRVFEDWLEIINSYTYTRGLPVYLTSTNTSQPDNDVKPAENYPRGWLTNALQVVNQEPQIKALCWFIDFFPNDQRWELFSLTNPAGLNLDAAQEFDELLRIPNPGVKP